MVPSKHPRPGDRSFVIDWAGKLMNRSDWVVLDTETTGTGPTDEVIQIAVVSPSGEVLLDTLVKPIRQDISPGAAKVHGITMEKLKDAPGFKAVAPALQKVLDGRLVIVYNVKFDARMLEQTTRKNKGVVLNLKVPMECAMDAYSTFVGEWNPVHDAYKWQKLPSAAHNAVDDCRAVIEVLKKMANAGQSPEAADSQPAKDSAGCRVKQEVKKYTLSLSSK